MTQVRKRPLPRTERRNPRLSPQARWQIARDYQFGRKIMAIAAEHGCHESWVPILARKLGCTPRRPDISARLTAYHQRHSARQSR